MEDLTLLGALPLFRGIPAGDLPGLLAQTGARRRRFAKGELALCRGETTEQLGLVLSGSLHILREDFWGGRTIVGLAGVGDCFAETYALLGLPLEVSVLAAADTEALFLGPFPDPAGPLAANLMALLAGKNLQLTRKMNHMARRIIRDKLLSYLSAQAQLAGGPVFSIPLDRQQLADYLAVDRSAMSAALGRLRDEGVLEFHKNSFRLFHGPEEP